jgi:hypothetical protein
MLVLVGEFQSMYRAPEGTTKDGKSYGGDYRVQLIKKELLKNGEFRSQLVTLKVKDPRPFQGMEGKKIHVPVGTYISGEDVRYYIPQSAKLGDVASFPTELK